MTQDKQELKHVPGQLQSGRSHIVPKRAVKHISDKRKNKTTMRAHQDNKDRDDFNNNTVFAQ